MAAGDAIFEPRGVPHADEFLGDTIQIEFKLPETAKAP
jgi:quercetin dioxygenase-like cupin family protein